MSATLKKRRSSAKRSTSSSEEEYIDGSAGAAAAANKRLRSQDPDVTVVVGTGSEKEEFLCYRLFLCGASEYFDTMLSVKMKENEESRIEFPDKKPEEWKLCYSFMDPKTCRSAMISEDNVETLIPLFHEFQMWSLLEECDDVLCHKFDVLSRDSWCWARDDRSDNEDVETILKHLERLSSYVSLINLYDLKHTQEEVLDDLFSALSFISNHVDTPELVIKKVLIPSVWQQQQQGGATSEVLWNWAQPLLPDTLDYSENLDDIVNNDLFPHLLAAGIKLKKVKMANNTSILKTAKMATRRKKKRGSLAFRSAFGPN